MTENLLLLGLPFSSDCGDSQPSVQFQHITRRLGPVGQALRQFVIPPLKVGTLDSLMEASDDLTKLDPQCEGTVLKLISLMEEASQKPRRDVTVLRISQSQEMTADGYLKHFQWNTSQFDTKEPVRSLIERMGLVASGAEERVRQVLTDFTETRSKLATASRKSQGSLAMRPLGDLLEKWSTKHEIVNTELLTTIFVAVPVSSQSDWLSSYWQVNDFVCPQSTTVVAEDKEFVLNSVVLFKKVADDFKLGCRKRKYIVRDFTGDELTAEELRALTQKAEQERTTLLALLTQQYSLCYVAWIHIKALRVFVECMLKYGLPPRFVGVALAVDDRKEAEIRQKISATFPNLKSPWSDDHHDTGALQHEYPYVSIKVTNVLKG